MADPVTVNVDDGFIGGIVTVFITHTSAGATSETINLPDDAPKFDLTKPHPVIGGIYIDIETDDASASTAILPEQECARAATPDTANGNWAIYDLDTIKIHLTSNLDGILALTYWAAGMKNT